MSWKTTLVVLAAVVSAAHAGLSVNSCVLQSDTAVKQFKLSTLNRMFGDQLTTESNGFTYIISICRPVPEIYYDPRQLAGSIKITAEGYAIDLGRIDQTNVVVNENTIVLTYVGGDRDRNSRDTCKGLKWSTYVTFICEPFLIKDVLTLIDEDPDQPEMCQIWFEVRTSKTCNRDPDIPLDVLGIDLMKENKQNYDEKYNEMRHNSSSLPIAVASPYLANNIKPKNNEGKKDSSITNENENSKKILSDNVNEEKFQNTDSESKSSKNEKEILANDHARFNDHKTNSNKIPSNSEHKENSGNTNTENKPSRNGNESSEKNNGTLNQDSMNSDKIPSGSEHKQNSENSQSGNESLVKNNDPLNRGSTNSNKIPSDTEHKENSGNTNTENKPSRNGNESSEKNNGTLNQDSMNSDKIPSGSEHKQNSENSQSGNESLVKNNDPSNHDSTNSNKIPSNSEHKENIENTNTENKPSSNGNESSDKNNGPLNQNSTNSDKIPPGNKAKQNSENIKSGNESSNPNNDSLNKNKTNRNTIPSDSEYKENSENATPTDNASRNGNDSSGKENELSYNNNINSTKIPSSSGKKDDSQSTNLISKGSRNENHNGLSNNTTVVNTHTSGEITNLSTEKSAVEPIVTKTTTDTSALIIAHVKPVNNAKITQNVQSVTEINQKSIESDKNTNLSNGKGNNDNSHTTGPTSQSDVSDSSGNFFSKGIKISSTGIIVAISSLVVGFGVIGTAINRYYYKLTGTDQIPFKRTFQIIFNFIEVYIIQKLCCCCGRDLEAAESTNEKTPLLSPKNVPTPTIEDETSPKNKKKKINSDESKQQRNENADNEESSEQNSKNEYGSMSNESNSQTSIKKYRKKKRKSKSSDKSSNNSGSENKTVDDKVKFIKTEFNDLQGKSIKGIISKKFNTLVDTKVKPVFESIFGKTAGDVDKNDKGPNKKEIITEELNQDDGVKKKSTFENIFGKPATEEIETNQEQNKENSVKGGADVEIKSSTNNADVVEEQDKVISSQLDVEQEKIGTPLDENESKSNISAIVEPIVVNTRVPVTETIAIKKENQNDVFNVPKDSAEATLTGIGSKNNESKLKFLGINVEKEKADAIDVGIMPTIQSSSVPEKEKDTDVIKKTSNVESSVSEEKPEGDEDDVEVIEEIIYVDAEGDEGDEEIIEEVTETTTTTEDPQDEFDDTGAQRRPSQTVTTVRKTSVRKISSSSLPGVETETVSETVEVVSNTPESEKKPFGFEFGIGKSGVNVTMGEKKLGIGNSGLKFGKREESPQDGRKPEAISIKLDKSGLQLNHGKQREKSDGKSVDGEPEKTKTRSISVPNFKIFKKSTSYPATSEKIRETEDVATPELTSKKSSRSLLKFGKSRSKSTGVMSTEVDVTMDPNVLYNFLDHERHSVNLQRSQDDANDAAQPSGDDIGKVVAAAENVISSLSPTTNGSSPSPPTLSSVAKEVEKVFPFKTIGTVVGESVGAAAAGIGSAAAADDDGDQRKSVRDLGKKTSNKKKRGTDDKPRLF